MRLQERFCMEEVDNALNGKEIRGFARKSLRPPLARFASKLAEARMKELATGEKSQYTEWSRKSSRAKRVLKRGRSLAWLYAMVR